MKSFRLHETLVGSARATPEVWRLALGLVLIAAGFLALNLLYFRGLTLLPHWPDLRHELRNGTSARALWVMLLNFLPLLVMVGVVAQALHGRSFAQVTGPLPIVLRDFRRVLRFAVILFAVVLVLPGPEGMQPEQHSSLGRWLMILPVSLVLVMVQVTTEEVLFRGYIQSQLAARFSSPWVWMLGPSIVFGFLHYEPATYGENALLLVIWAAAFGVAAADLTARAGNLGPAIALHFVNNVVAMSFTAMKGYWDGLALYVLPFGPDDIDALRATLPPEALVILCSWLVARLALRR